MMVPTATEPSPRLTLAVKLAAGVVPGRNLATTCGPVLTFWVPVTGKPPWTLKPPTVPGIS